MMRVAVPQFHRAHVALCALFSLLVGCGTTVSTHVAANQVRVPERLELLLPAAPPAGFRPAIEVTPRSRDDIFEQINGGSVSFLENGMTNALFAVYPMKGADEGVEITLELYRFGQASGAKKQFENLHGDAGKVWQGATAVIHEFGVELVAGTLMVRATFNDGPEKPMVLACKALALHALESIRQDD